MPESVESAASQSETDIISLSYRSSYESPTTHRPQSLRFRGTSGHCPALTISPLNLLSFLVLLKDHFSAFNSCTFRNTNCDSTVLQNVWNFRLSPVRLRLFLASLIFFFYNCPAKILYMPPRGGGPKGKTHGRTR